LKLARLLEAVREGEYYKRWGFSGFMDYLKSGEVSLGYRACFYLLSVLDAKRRAKIKESDIIEIGWRKVSLVAKQINTQNRDRLLDLCRENSMTDLGKLLYGWTNNRGRNRKRISYSVERGLDRPLDIRALEALRKLPEFRSLELDDQKGVVDELSWFLTFRENLQLREAI
jgi:hypothetical protein